MFFNNETFEKYSIIGKFLDQIKLCELNSRTNDFDLEKYMKECNHNLEWFDLIVDSLAKKNEKLEALKDQKSNLESTVYNTRSTNQTHQQARSVQKPIQSQDHQKQQQQQIQPQQPLYRTNQQQNANKEQTYQQQQQQQQQQPLHRPNQQQNANNEQTSQQQKPQQNHPRQQQSFYHKYPWSNNQRAVEIMRNWYPLRFKLDYPKKSYLNSNEQKEFLELNAKFHNCNDLVTSDSKKYKKYVYLRTILNRERNEFMQYSQSYFEHALNDDYQFIIQEVQQYTDEMLNLLENVAMQFDRFYKPVDKIVLSGWNDRGFLKFERNLLQLGKVPTINVPNVTSESQPTLPTNYGIMNSRAPVAKNQKNYTKKRISADENAEKLAIKHKANIVMTSSTFEYLMNEYNEENESIVAVIVKNFKLNDDETHKIVFIEKPFIKKNLSKREKNEKFFKKSLNFGLIKQQTRAVMMNRRLLNNGQPVEEKTQAVNESQEKSIRVSDRNMNFEDNEINYDLINNMDSFGCGVEKRAYRSDSLNIEKNEKTSDETISVNSQAESNSNNLKRKVRESQDSTKSLSEKKQRAEDDAVGNVMDLTISKQHDNLSESDDDQGLIIDLFTNNEKADKEDIESPGPASPEHQTNFEVEEAKIEQPKMIPLDKPNLLRKETVTPKEPQKVQETLNEYKMIDNIHNNINYSLWSFGTNFKVIIRWSQDGVILNENLIRQGVVLMSKLEYQPQFGCEKITKREYCKMWSKSFIRNCCDVLLCRINVFTNKIISITNYKHNSILNVDGGFNPNQAMIYAYSLLNKLIPLEPSNYLLRKKEKVFNTYTVARATDSKQNSFDLHFHYSGFDAALFDPKPTWIPIDSEIYLPYHHALGRIPCTFEPEMVEVQQRKAKKKRKKNKNNAANK